MLITLVAVDGTYGLTRSGDYHSCVRLGDMEMFGYFVEFPSVAVVAPEYIPITRREMAFDESVDFGYLIVAVGIFLYFRMAVNGIYISFGMGLSSSLPVDRDVAGGYRQESFGLSLRGEIGTTGPETAECFLQGVFIVVGVSRHQSTTH